MSRLQLAIEQITFARGYTQRLLEQTKEAIGSPAARRCQPYRVAGATWRWVNIGWRWTKSRHAW